MQGSMPYTSLGLIRTLHVLTVAITLGALVTLPAIRSRLEEADDSRTAATGLAFVGQIQRWLVVPGTLGVLVFGLAMVEGPLAAFSFTAPGAGWLHIGTTLWMVLAGAVALMWYSHRELVEQARNGATGGDTVRTHWNRWTAGAIVGALVTAGGVAVMAMKLGA